MRVKGMCDVEVVCDEALQPGLALVDGCRVFCAAEGNVGAAGYVVSIWSSS
jgi:hypothetical protein